MRTRRHRGAAAVLAVVTAFSLIGYSCAAPEPPPPATTTTTLPVLVFKEQARPVIPLSYEIDRAERQITAALGQWWHWATQAVYGDDAAAFEVDFGWRGFTPDSSIDYGPASVGGETQVQLGDASYMIDNRRGTVAVPFQRQVAVKYSQSATASLSATIEIDAGVSVGARVGNPTTPAGLNTEISTALKISGTKTDVSGWSQDRTETQTIGPVSVPAGHALLAAISAPQVRLTQAMTANGYLDTAVTISFANRALGGFPGIPLEQWMPWILAQSEHASGATTFNPDTADARVIVAFDSIDAFVSFLQGYNVDWPKSLDRRGSTQADGNGQQFADSIIAASLIQWHGTVHRTTERSSTYTFTDIAPDQVEATIAREAIAANRVIDTAAVSSPS